MYLVEQKNEINASSFCKFFNQTKKAKAFAHLAKRTLAAHDVKNVAWGVWHVADKTGTLKCDR